jgi:hypothetical protein
MILKDVACPLAVTQIFNLLYRRFAIGWALNGCRGVGSVRALQNEILRYGRLKICVTKWAAGCLCPPAA